MHVDVYVVKINYRGTDVCYWPKLRFDIGSTFQDPKLGDGKFLPQENRTFTDFYFCCWDCHDRSVYNVSNN